MSALGRLLDKLPGKSTDHPTSEPAVDREVSADVERDGRIEDLKQERDGLRTILNRIHQTISQLKADYQVMMKRVTDLSSTEDMVLDNVRFLIIELDSTLRKYEDAT